MCVLRGIQDKYTIEGNNRVVQIVVRTYSGIDVPLTLAKKKYGDTNWKYSVFDQIYDEWCRAIGKQIPKTESEECEENNEDVEQKVQNGNGTIWGFSKTEWLIYIICMILYILYHKFCF